MRSQGKRQHHRHHHNHVAITAWAPSFDLDNGTVPTVEKKTGQIKMGAGHPRTDATIPVWDGCVRAQVTGPGTPSAFCIPHACKRHRSKNGKQTNFQGCFLYAAGMVLEVGRNICSSPKEFKDPCGEIQRVVTPAYVSSWSRLTWCAILTVWLCLAPHRNRYRGSHHWAFFVICILIQKQETLLTIHFSIYYFISRGSWSANCILSTQMSESEQDTFICVFVVSFLDPMDKSVVCVALFGFLKSCRLCIFPWASEKRCSTKKAHQLVPIK